jgi:hypothetical protein
MPNLLIHIFSNLVLIFLIWFFDKDFKKKKQEIFKLFLVVLSSNFIDLDHLLANPIYDPLRCSINFHPLHSWYIMPIYLVGIFFKNKYFKYFCLNVLIHLLLDFVDCLILL